MTNIFKKEKNILSSEISFLRFLLISSAFSVIYNEHACIVFYNERKVYIFLKPTEPQCIEEETFFFIKKTLERVVEEGTKK